LPIYEICRQFCETRRKTSSTASTCLGNGLANALFFDSRFLENSLSFVTENVADTVIQPTLECYAEHSALLTIMLAKS